MEIEIISINELSPYENNSRTHSDTQIDLIISSIKEYGFTNPVLIDKDNGIIAGHGRITAAKKAGLEQVPCVRLSDLTEEKKRAYVIADNQIALLSEWDEKLLYIELSDLKNMEYDINFTGFSIDEINGLFVDEIGMPELKSGDRNQFQRMTFTLHDSQVEQVNIACDIAKKMGTFDSLNENSNGNSLARICETFITDYGNS